MAWSSYTIKQIAEKFALGEIRLPEMQRPYVWKSSQVARLFDSLYRGYPIGTILLWEMGETVITRPSAFISDTQNSILTRPLILLDGQQRLTSILRVINDDKKLYFNLEYPQAVEDVDDDELLSNEKLSDERANRLSKQTFQMATVALRQLPFWIPVKRVFDGQDFDLLTELRSFAEDDTTFNKWKQRINGLKKVLDYPLQIETLPHSLDYEQVADIFVRVNSGGTRLRGTDLALAQITSRWPGSLQLFEEEVRDLEKAHFSFDIAFIVRAIVLCATSSSRLRELAEVPIEKLRCGWEQTQRGLRRAVQFVRDDALIESSKFLTSKNVFLPLVARFGVGPDEMSDEERKAWVAWFYLASIWSRYSTNAGTRLSQDIAAIVDGKRSGSEIPNRLLETIRQQVGHLYVESHDLNERYDISTKTFMIHVIAREQNAVCWKTGMTLSFAAIGSEHDVQIHHIFPRAQLGDSCDLLSRDNIGNIAFIRAEPNQRISDSLPRDYLTSIVADYGEERLTSQCVPTEPLLWELDFYEDFLETRRAQIARAINDPLAHLGVQR